MLCFKVNILRAEKEEKVEEKVEREERVAVSTNGLFKSFFIIFKIELKEANVTNITNVL